MKRFDFHVHSTCSKHNVWGIDGINTPQEIVDMAIQLGLDGLAITDHNTIKGSQKAIQYVKEKSLPVLIIPGAEVRSLAGDILALGINENVPQKLSILETVDAIKDAGLRDGLQIMLGGGQINEQVRIYTGADAYGDNAVAAVKLAKEWIGG